MQMPSPSPQTPDLFSYFYDYSPDTNNSAKISSSVPVQLCYHNSQINERENIVLANKNLDIANVEGFAESVTQPTINFVNLENKLENNLIKRGDLAENPYSEYTRTDYIHKPPPTLIDGIQEDTRIMSIQENNMYMAITMGLATISITFLLLR